MTFRVAHISGTDLSRDKPFFVEGLGRLDIAELAAAYGKAG
jgi:hypothetical protein